ncbi:hypothetical protein FQZ97_1071660 [compost metagenome]
MGRNRPAPDADGAHGRGRRLPHVDQPRIALYAAERDVPATGLDGGWLSLHLHQQPRVCRQHYWPEQQGQEHRREAAAAARIRVCASGCAGLSRPWRYRPLFGGIPGCEQALRRSRLQPRHRLGVSGQQREHPQPFTGPEQSLQNAPSRLSLGRRRKLQLLLPGPGSALRRR